MDQVRKMIIDEIKPLKKRIFDLEVKLSEFTQDRHERNHADIDYIAMETGVDLEQDENLDQ